MEEFHREVNFGLAPWFLLHHMFVSASALDFGATSMYTTLHLQTKQEVSTQLQNHTFHIHTLHCFFCELLFLEGAFTCQHLETFGERSWRTVDWSHYLMQSLFQVYARTLARHSFHNSHVQVHTNNSAMAQTYIVRPQSSITKQFNR